MEEHHQPVDLTQAVLHSLTDERLQHKKVEAAVLRLDRIHPIVSGNKWFKLKYHLQQAVQQQKKGILTFGGAWSNHLVATAFACRQAGLASIGIVRGEQPTVLSATLQDAQQYGMQLQFVSRAAYTSAVADLPDHYTVPVGGQSPLGVAGASEILQMTDLASWSHIACAVGTGTMMAGLVKASLPHQQVIGISSLKDYSLPRFVTAQTARSNFELFFDYHFGGYARSNEVLIDFMNALYQQHQLPTDFVYTAKLLYGIIDLVVKDYFSPGSRVLIIHSGGLQGNRGLPAGQLTFL